MVDKEGVERLTTNLETERLRYKILVAGEVVEGKVVNNAVYISTKEKRV
jgi:hypothetical protein